MVQIAMSALSVVWMMTSPVWVVFAQMDFYLKLADKHAFKDQTTAMSWTRLTTPFARHALGDSWSQTTNRLVYQALIIASLLTLRILMNAHFAMMALFWQMINWNAWRVALLSSPINHKIPLSLSVGNVQIPMEISCALNAALTLILSQTSVQMG